MTEIKERPILYSAAMVRARMGGRKSQTRRRMKAETYGHAFTTCGPGPQKRASQWGAYFGSIFVPCPYGRPGDRLWVRETWAPCAGGVIYRADAKDTLCAGVAAEHDSDTGRWHPSIHMPRWASRGLDVITGVRVERLQDITEADAVAEGIEEFHPEDPAHRAAGRWWSLPGTTLANRDPRIAYWKLWESINGPGSWDANPLVWVIEFKPVTP